MPTERFLNLPEEKRCRILDAARQELARVPFEQLSINQIVQQAGIPRGSFYQYFSGKDDLLAYIMESYGGDMRRSVKQWLRRYDGDIFRVFREILVYTVEFGRREGYFEVCRNIFAHLRIDEGETPPVIRFNIEALKAEFGPYARLERLRPGTDREMLDFLELLVVLLRRAIACAFNGADSAEAAIQSFEYQLELIKNGTVKAEDEI